MEITPLINGNRYSWSEIRLNISGIPIKDVVAIEYSEEQEKDYDYGAGNQVKGIVRGRKKPMGKITLNTEVVQVLRTIALPFGGSIVDIPSFPIIVIYQQVQHLPLVTHKLLQCEFTKDAVQWKEGDKKFDQDLDLIVKQIIWN